MAVSGIALLWRENRTYPSVEMDMLIVYGELLHVTRELIINIHQASKSRTLL
jgi:hypothetical protein